MTKIDFLFIDIVPSLTSSSESFYTFSSPELNINGNCPCQGHVFSNGPTSRGAHGYDQERNRPGSEQLRRPSCQHCNRQTEATSPAREYRNTHQVIKIDEEKVKDFASVVLLVSLSVILV